MTLAELRKENAHLFNMSQDWFRDEAFMRHLARPCRGESEMRFMPLATVEHPLLLPTLTQLLPLYVANPEHDIWNNYLWCRDLDQHGQRIYMGKNERGMEIHRHLHLTERFGVVLFSEAA